MTKKRFHSVTVVAFVLIPLCAIICFSSKSFAESEVIYATHKTVLGDNDSKNDARRMCFLEAKRLVLEKAGTYIESNSKVKNFQLTNDEISTYAAALLKVDIIKEEWKMVGENMAIVMTVKAEVDQAHIEKQFSKIKSDVSVQEKLKDQQKKISELEDKLTKIHNELKAADPDDAIPLRKERSNTLEDIDRIEEKYAVILKKLRTRKEASREDIINVLKYIEIDMTQEDVEYILGEPNSRCKGRGICYYYYREHGQIQIWFKKIDTGEKYVSSIDWKPRICGIRVHIKDRKYNILNDGINRNHTSHRKCKDDINEYILFDKVSE